MEITSFILGMSTIIFMALLAYSIRALIQMKSEMAQMSNNLDVLQRSFDEYVGESYNAIDEIRNEFDSRFSDTYRSLDSRLNQIGEGLKVLQTHKIFKEKREESIPLGPLNPITPITPNYYPTYPYYPGYIPCWYSGTWASNKTGKVYL